MAAPTFLSTVPAHTRIVETNEEVTGVTAKELIRVSRLFDTPTDDIEILDNATGGGILPSLLFSSLKTSAQARKIARVIAGDIDDSMLSVTRGRAEHEQWTLHTDSLSIMKIDQTALPFPDNTFTHIFSNMGIIFSPKDATVLTETYRALRPNGSTYFATWRKVTWWTEIAVPMLERDFADAPKLPDPTRLFPGRDWDKVDMIQNKLENAGFSEVEVEEWEFSVNVRNDEFAEATAVLVSTVARRVWAEKWSEGDMEKIQAGLGQMLQEKYPGGRYTGSMKAVISSARKPSQLD